VIVALKKSWSKMSPRGREAALRLKFSPREQQLIRTALE